MTLCAILLTTSELTPPFLHEYDIQIKLLIETKPEVSSLGVNKMADSVMTAPSGKKWHPSQEGDLRMSWHENQDSSNGRAPG